MKRIRSMMDAVEYNNKMLKYLRDNYPANHEKNREDGYQAVWDLPKKGDPFHADGMGKTQHNENEDD